MSELSLFANQLATSDIFKKLASVNDNLLSGQGGGLTTRRISVKGGKFREVVNGEQIHVSKEDSMNIIVINAAAISRTYYAGTYDPNNVSAPKCWSSNSEKPDDSVPEDQRQARACRDCTQNIKGSGQGNSRACRFGQRLAIAIEGKLDTVYQLQLAATSIFGDAVDGKMPMGAYARYLKANNMPVSALVTQMYFDESSEVPKLYFKPVRPLTEDELNAVVKLMDTPEVERAITLTVAETDKLIATDKPAPEVKAAPAPSIFEEAEEVEEPVKVAKKAAPAPADASSLADVVAQWDDDE